MATKEELLRVPIFSDLPDDQISWFLDHSTEMSLKAGEAYSRAGDPADTMFVILEGELQGRGEFNGETFIFSTKVGDITGVLPFSRMKTFTVSGRAAVDSRALRFPASQFPESSAENAGVDAAPGRHDVRQDSRDYPGRTTT